MSNIAMRGQSLAELVNAQKPAFLAAIGGATPAQRQANAERFTRICLTALRRTPKLQSCDPASVLGAMMTCAQLNIEPNSPQGLAYLIPYGRECQFMIGYRGLIQLMYRSGSVASVHADVVYRQEVERGNFSYVSGLRPDIQHRIDLLDDCRSGDPKDIVAAYACAVLKSGESVIKVVTRKDIDDARRKGGANSPAWKDHYAAMAMKTAVKRLAPWVPATRIEEALEKEGAVQTAAAEPVQETPSLSLDGLNGMLSAPVEPEQAPTQVETAQNPE